MAGYWNSPAETAATLRGGWLHTGDIGRLDADGYLYVVDRKKDLIIRGGFNVFPRDVEDVLLQHPAVAMAGVVGRPDQRLGEEIVAFVLLLPGSQATPAEIMEFARGRRRTSTRARSASLTRCRSPAWGSWTARPSAARSPIETGDRSGGARGRVRHLGHRPGAAAEPGRALSHRPLQGARPREVGS